MINWKIQRNLLIREEKTIDILSRHQYISSAFELIIQVTTSFAVSKPNEH